MRVATGTAALAVGDHDVRVHWFDHGGGAGAIVHYKGPDIPDFVLLLAYTTHKFGCDECAFGKYKTAPGDGVCALCAAGKFSAVTNLVSNVCACNSGTTGPNRFGAYPSCSVGTYKTNSGSAACTACGAGKFSAVTSSVLNVCDCNAGSTGPTVLALCTSCGVGIYKTDLGSASCTLCATGKFSAVTGSVSNVCAGNAGTTGPDGIATCASCVEGTYKTNPGSAVCSGCGAGKFSAVTGSISNVYTCNAGTTGPAVVGATGDAACSICLKDQYSTAVGAVSNTCQDCPVRSISGTGSAKKTDCICKAGSTGPHGGE